MKNQVWCADCEDFRESTGACCAVCGGRAVVNALRLLEGTVVAGVVRCAAVGSEVQA